MSKGDLTVSDNIKVKSALWLLKNIATVIATFSCLLDLEKLRHAFVSGRVDYCNALLTGLPKVSITQRQLIQKLQLECLQKLRKESTIPQLSGLYTGFQLDTELNSKYYLLSISQ